MVLNPKPYTLNPKPYALHPTPCTLRPTPCTLHPAPYTLHPTPCTLHLDGVAARVLEAVVTVGRDNVVLFRAAHLHSCLGLGFRVFLGGFKGLGFF